MAKELTGTSTYHATVTCPVGGDPRVAESVEAGLQDLTDIAAYLKTERDTLNSKISTLEGSGEFVQPLVFTYNENDNWNYTTDGFPEDQSGGQHTAIAQCTNVIQNATVVGFRARVIGGAGHAGLPSAPPRIRLRKTVHSGSSPSSAVLISMTDVPASVAAYQACHDVQVFAPGDFTAFTLSPYDESYWWEIRSEGGTNAQDGYRVLAITLALQLASLRFPNTD
jgi:hypothetical protein